MLKTIRLFTLLSVLLPSLAVAATDKADLITSITEKSGLSASLDSLPEQFIAQAMQQKPYAKDPQALDAVTRILSDNVDKAKMQQTLFDTFDKSMSTAELTAVQNWLNSDLGSKIADAEAKASNPANMQDIQLFVASFQTQPPSQERIQAIQSFVEKSQLVEASMNMVEQIMSSMMNGLEAFNEDPDYAKVEEALEQTKQVLKPALWQQMILMSHYSYQDLTVEQINQYTDYLSTPAGKKYLDTGLDAVTAVISQIMETAAPQIKEAAQANKNS